MLILHTKMIPPRRSRGVLPRPRLERLADAMGEHKVTIVKAPAGYGKSTLGRTWIEELGAAGARVGWLSADAADADPSRLAVYIAATLNRADAGLGRVVGVEIGGMKIAPNRQWFAAGTAKYKSPRLVAVRGAKGERN